MFHVSSQMFIFHLYLPHPYFPFPQTNIGQRRGPLHHHPPNQPCRALPRAVGRVRRVQLFDSHACRRVLNRENESLKS